MRTRPIETNTKGGDKPRHENDRYITDPKLCVAICSRLRQEIGTPAVIIEPSAGSGNFVRGAREVWGKLPRIIAIEANRTPNYVELEKAGASQVIYGRWEDCHEEVPRRAPAEDTILILGNPPFDLPEDKEKRAKLPMQRRGEIPVTAERHTRLALERLGHFGARGPTLRYLAFLLRQSFVAGPRVGEGRLFGPLGAGGLRHRWDIDPRPSYSEDGKSDGAEYNVCVWQAGFKGRYEGDWISDPKGNWRK